VSDAAADCLFCRIVAGEIPATVVAESDMLLAFRDIAPAAPLHLLIVPKSHVRDASALDASHGPLLASMLTLANELAESEGVAQSGYRLVWNVGDDAGNSVPHLHLHLLGGRVLAWPPG
jgi:histidine triad (HIT) family protein